MLRDGNTERMVNVSHAERLLLGSRPRYHCRCLREDVTNPELTDLKRLALVRGRARRMHSTSGNHTP